MVISLEKKNADQIPASAAYSLKLANPHLFRSNALNHVTVKSDLWPPLDGKKFNSSIKMLHLESSTISAEDGGVSHNFTSVPHKGTCIASI